MIHAAWMTIMTLLGPVADARVDDKKGGADDLPKVVARAVKKAYPEAKVVGVSREKDEEGETVYEVETKLDGKSVDLIVDEEGEIEAVEKEIEADDLPKAVRKAIKAKYGKAKVAKVEELTGEDDKVLYEVAFEAEGKEPFEVLFAPNGKVVEDEKEEEKGEAKKKDKDDEKGEKKGKKDKDDEKEEKGEKPRG